MREENFSRALNKEVLERVSSLEQVFIKKVNELFTTNQKELISTTEEESTRIEDFKREIFSEMTELLQKIEKMDYKYTDFQNKLSEITFKGSRYVQVRTINSLNFHLRKFKRTASFYIRNIFKNYLLMLPFMADFRLDQLAYIYIKIIMQ